MNIVAGVLAILFGLGHGAPALGQIRSPVAARGSGEPASIPVWARSLWLVLALVSVVGGVLLIATNDSGCVVIVALGCVGLSLLAIANGFWIHGRPNASHHIVRGALAAGIVALALIGVS